jgi:transposase
MATRFVNIDRDTPLLLPPDLRDWVPADPLAHFILDAVEALDLQQVKVNTRGTGDAQYPPAMLLGLLIYSYATGTFGSRRMEQSTFENIAVRLITADTHPDPDTICTFRRENQALSSESLLTSAVTGDAAEPLAHARSYTHGWRGSAGSTGLRQATPPYK